MTEPLTSGNAAGGVLGLWQVGCTDSSIAGTPLSARLPSHTLSAAIGSRGREHAHHPQRAAGHGLAIGVRREYGISSRWLGGLGLAGWNGSCSEDSWRFAGRR